MTRHQEQAKMLMECLPYIKKFSGETIVIKYGGHAMESEPLKQAFAQNIALLHYVGINVVIVHGGGPQIGSLLDQLNIKSTFLQGQRVTDAATMEVVEMVLVGRVNNDVVNHLNMAGVKAIGLSGKDGHCIKARKMEMFGQGENSSEKLDLGLVGEVIEVDARLLSTLSSNEFTPVLAPVGVDSEGNSYNINADSAAGAVAAALKAKRLMLLTDVAGVKDSDGNLISSISISEAESFFEDGTFSGGMIPKMRCCVDAINNGVERAVVIDGRVKNCILLELFTDSGVGTQVTA